MKNNYKISDYIEIFYSKQFKIEKSTKLDIIPKKMISEEILNETLAKLIQNKAVGIDQLKDNHLKQYTFDYQEIKLNMHLVLYIHIN
jgi:hypothetical protein